MGKSHNKHAIHKAVAFIMPVVIIAIIGFATWVFCGLICVNYLLKQQHRKGTAICLLTFYILFLLPLLTAYLRVVYAINSNPGYVSLGPKPPDGKAEGDNREDGEVRRGSHGRHIGSWIPLARSSNSAAQSSTPQETPHVPNPPSVLQSSETRAVPPPPPTLSLPSPQVTEHHQQQQQTRDSLTVQLPFPNDGRDFRNSRPISFHQSEALKNLSDFYSLDAFICEGDGLPRWCGHCNCWKPDRSHHCREVGRCVMKMDHFCPWVGGVVGETVFKFFYQVLVYATIYCIFVLAVTGVSLNSYIEKNKYVPSTWTALIALAAIFGVFSAAMAFSTTQLIWRNTTTIDNLSASTKVYQIALYDPLAMEHRDSVFSQHPSDEHGDQDIEARQEANSLLRPEQSHHPSMQPQDQSHAERPPPSPIASPPARLSVPSSFLVSCKRVTFPYDDPAYASWLNRNQATGRLAPASRNNRVSPSNYDIVPRTFVVAKTQPGDNPWILPGVWENFAEVLGYRFWEWWLPVRPSPCSRHLTADAGDGNRNADLENGKKAGRTSGWYRWNEELLARLRKECGIRAPWEVAGDLKAQKRRRTKEAVSGLVGSAGGNGEEQGMNDRDRPGEKKKGKPQRKEKTNEDRKIERRKTKIEEPSPPPASLPLPDNTVTAKARTRENGT